MQNNYKVQARINEFREDDDPYDKRLGRYNRKRNSSKNSLANKKISVDNDP